MLAVQSAYRNAGLGRQVKLFQRKDALARGFELREWTFDPLEIKNAYLNIERLGAIARRYHVNQYGLTSSPLQGGLPSDRLVAEWWLKSQRVESVLNEGQKSEFKQKFETVKTISVPGQIYEWKASAETRERAREVQEHNRKDFLQAFGDGLAVLGYERDSQGDGKFLLGHWSENWNCSS
jgi:predicted GNAT superfamily acetyltransferase